MASKGFEDGYLGKPKLYFGENETDGIFYEREYEKGVSARLLEDWEKEKRENEDIKRAFQKGQDEIFQARMEQVERDCEKLEESLANALKSVDKKNDEVPAYTFIEDPPEQTQEVDLPKLLGTIDPSSFNEYPSIGDSQEQTQEVDLPKLLGTIEPSSFNENDT